jgi:hypothetical protein
MAGVNLANRFNRRQSLAAHEPVGVINRVRKLICSELARFDAEKNGQPS